MTHSNDKMDEMVQLATQQQQVYYELLPDWWEYLEDEHEYLKNNIGFSLFGPPEVKHDANAAFSMNGMNRVAYDKNQLLAINVIYNKILQFRTDPKSNIFLAILYNVILLNGGSTKSKSKDATDSPESKQPLSVPVFKTRRLLSPGVYKTHYIDINGRMYKDWNDYKDNNQLPQCTMVLPKSGFYQCDPTCKVTKLHSSVWIEIVNSPTCRTSKKVLKAMDVASSVLGIGASVGIGATAMLTPVGPLVAAAGLVSTGLSGAWTIGRCSQELVDRSSHQESIVNRKAIPAWLGIAGSALGMGSNAGAVLMTRSITTGSRVGKIATLAFNSTVIGNLTVNGVGVAYQSFLLIEKYKEKREIDLTDVFLLSSHVLFFSNAVLNAKLATSFVESSRGSIMDRFKNYMRSNRVRQEYNRVSNCHASGNNLGIVRRVTTIESIKDLIGESRKSSTLSIMDPISFVGFLLLGNNKVASIVTKGITALTERNMNLLLRCLSQLLRTFCSANNIPSSKMPSTGDFDDILQELSHIKNAESIFPKIFHIARALVSNLDNPNRFLVDVVIFLWNYVKVNIHNYKKNVCDYFKDTPIDGLVSTVVTTIHDNIDNVLDELFNAFYSYMINTKNARYSV